MSVIPGAIPEGYIAGLRRWPEAKIAHLYKGSFQEPGLPMCLRGWTNPDRGGYSIFRNLPYQPVCEICLRRARKGLEGVESRDPSGIRYPKDW